MRVQLRTHLALAATLVGMAAVGAAAFDLRLECVDAAKRTNLNQRLAGIGGSADVDTSVCVFKKGPIVGHSHLKLVDSSDIRNCYELIGKPRRFLAAGCGPFAEVSAQLKRIFDAINAFIDREVDAADTTAAKESRIRVRRTVANDVLESLSKAAAVSPANVVDELKGSDDQFSTLAVKMSFGTPLGRFLKSDLSDPLVEVLGDTVTIDSKQYSNKRYVRDVVQEMITEMRDLLAAPESQRALRCLPVTLARVGLSGGNGLSDDSRDYQCKERDVKKTIKQRPACARIAVGQLLEFNRASRIDKKAPWKLVMEVGALVSAKSTHRRLDRLYSDESFVDKCVSSQTKKNGKPRRVVCWAFTQCFASVAHFVGEALPGCKPVVRDASVDDDGEELAAANTAMVGLQVASKDVNEDEATKSPPPHFKHFRGKAAAPPKISSKDPSPGTGQLVDQQ